MLLQVDVVLDAVENWCLNMLTAMQEVEPKQATEINWDDLLPRLILYSLRLIKSYDLEERVSPEDVALSAIERFMKYERDAAPLHNLSGFLMRVARNIVIDEARREHIRKRRLEESSTSDDLFLDRQSVTREVENKELREALLQAVRDDPKLAEMVETLLEDPSLRSRELAERLGVGLGQVYQLKKRLNKRLIERVPELAHSQ